MSNLKKTAIILLSGGLDSLVSLQKAQEFCDVKMALTFDYSQHALSEEIEASREISRFYNIEHRVVKLPFLAEITNNALTCDENLDFEKFDNDSAKAVWVPNRNGLFLNIAACFCESFNFDFIIIGANKEEAGTFIDNSLEFLERADEFFEFSTQKKPKILAPLKDMEKFEIINYAVANNVPLKYLKSCYNSIEKTGAKHCGKCESCKRLHQAILKSVNKDLINLFF